MTRPLALSLCLLIVGMLTFSNCSEDDGPLVKISFQLSSSTVHEGANSIVAFTISLPSGSTANITLGGTATRDVDYTYSVTSSGIQLSAADDGLYDPDETIIITLTGFTGNAELGTNLTHTVTITETPLVIEFVSQANTRIEGQGLVIPFTTPLPAGVTCSYTVTGTATGTADYTYTQGQNNFAVSTKTDEIYDPNETIIIELTGFSGNVIVGTKKTYTVTITDEDESQAARLEISLEWEISDGSAGDVDIDLLVWRETSPGVYTSQGNLISDNAGTTFEATSIPANEPDGKWGLSYLYFTGTSDDVNVKSEFRSYKGNVNTTSNRASFDSTYTLLNLNSDYDLDFGNGDNVLAQTYIKTGSNYTELGAIHVASSGSRSKPTKFILDDATRNRIKAKLLKQGERH